jgi:hypothetical protein
MQKFFDDDWLTFQVDYDGLTVGQSALIWKIADDIGMSADVGISRMVDGIKKMQLGINPVVSLSGGVDSQAVCLLLRAANIDFKIAIMQYENDLNDMDVSSAVSFCETKGFNYEIIKFNVIPFLTQELSVYVALYECPSPQFAVHFKFYEMLMTRGASSILAGGSAPYWLKDRLVYPITISQNAWTVFARKNDFNLYGNVLGWSPDIAIPLIKNSPNVNGYGETLTGRYASKIAGMLAVGLDVIAQPNKYTGFEKIKQLFAQHTGDPLFFDKSFRYRFFRTHPDLAGVLLPNLPFETAIKTL